MDYICYGSPISDAKEYMEDYLAESEIVYPSEEVLESGSSYAYLSEEISRYVESLYQKATKTADSVDPGAAGSDLPVVILAIALFGTGVLLLLPKKRSRR